MSVPSTTLMCSTRRKGLNIPCIYSWGSAWGWDVAHVDKAHQGPALHKLTDMQQISRNQQLYIVDMRVAVSCMGALGA